MLDIMHASRPKEMAQTTKGTPGSFNFDEHFEYDNSATMKLLNFKLITIEQSFTELYDQIQSLKKESEK